MQIKVDKYKMKCLINICVYLTYFLTATNCLNLKRSNIGNNFYASSVAVFKNRAFLTLPRSSCYNKISDPTLIEVFWNFDYNSLLAGRNLYYPSKTSQQWGKCNVLQDAISLDVEIKRALLWILDKGTQNCPPKIVIYNLYSNTEIYTCVFDQFSSWNANILVVDPLEARAYVGSSTENKLVVFSLKDKKWWILKCVESTTNDHGLMTTEVLAISKSEQILYLTSYNNSELFYINLTSKLNMNNSTNQQLKVHDIQAKFLGHKLGSSGGMTTDPAGGLNYYLTRDFAVVRWMTNMPLRAENHDVLMQSFEDLPYVSHLFNGAQNSVWALVNYLPPKWCSNETEKKLPSQLLPKSTDLQKRVVKLYNIRGRRGNVLVLGI